MHTLSHYWGTELDHLKARWWLKGRNRDALAADALFVLNRHARQNNDQHRWSIYRLKNAAIEVFYQKGYCTYVQLDKQDMPCWDCEGTGEVWFFDELSEKDRWQCDKCNGTGVYRTNWLVNFHFTIGDKTYIWHQPKDLVRFAYTLTDQAVKSYSEREEPQPFGENSIDMNIAILYEYLRAEGVPESLLTVRQRFCDALKWSLWEHRRLRWVVDLSYTLCRVRMNTRRLKTFLIEGYLPEEEHDFPF